jgi:rfaE bifunctional protein kinase chain/domain
VKHVLVVGDVMVDRYVCVTSSRMAQEAHVPVWDVIGVERRWGGAANVAANLKALGGDDIDVHLAGILSREDRQEIQKLGIDTSSCISAGDAGSMVKERIIRVETREILARVDNFRQFDEWDIMDLSMMMRGPYDAIVVSDYDKGSVSNALVARIMAPLKIVDSKRRDLRIFQSFDVLKVNRDEYAAQVNAYDDGPVEKLFKNVVVTMGKDGASLNQYDAAKTREIASDPRNHFSVKQQSAMYVLHTENFKVDPVEAVDVTGCGDTHTAAMALSMLNDGDVRAAVRFANQCARAAVGKFGTTVVRQTDIV